MHAQADIFELMSSFDQFTQTYAVFDIFDNFDMAILTLSSRLFMRGGLGSEEIRRISVFSSIRKESMANLNRGTFSMLIELFPSVERKWGENLKILSSTLHCNCA